MNEVMKSVVRMFDDMVDSKFVEFAMYYFNMYKSNRSKLKVKHILLNLPLGAFVSADQLDPLINDRMSQDDLLMICRRLREDILRGISSSGIRGEVCKCVEKCKCSE